MQRSNDLVEQAQKIDEKTPEKTVQVCPICGKPATQSVDGEPSCPAHVEQVYEHQVEDYTRRHLIDNEWRKV
jgi:uncharacterized Zn finger protein (UPF0148 family)